MARIVFLTARHDPDPVFPDFKYEIYLVDVDGANQRRLTFTDEAEGHPAWSPDGQRIVFDADYDGDGYAEIYTMDVDGSDVSRLTDNDANDQFADWSPDGAHIAFASDRSGNWDVYLMDSDGSNQRPLATGPDWELFPAWSPDGSRIAYNGLAAGSRNTDIYLIESDGTGVRQLTDEPGFDENPAWSPDGSMIVFQTRRGGSFDLYVMNADGSHPFRVDQPSEDFWPSWSDFTQLENQAPLVQFERARRSWAWLRRSRLPWATWMRTATWTRSLPTRCATTPASG